MQMSMKTFFYQTRPDQVLVSEAAGLVTQKTVSERTDVSLDSAAEKHNGF